MVGIPAILAMLSPVHIWLYMFYHIVPPALVPGFIGILSLELSSLIPLFIPPPPLPS